MAESDLFPLVKKSGQALSDQWLRSMSSLRVERAVGLIGRATLRFDDVGYSLSTSNAFALGTDITISEPDADILLEGTVTGVNLELTTRNNPQLVVVIDDAGYKLMRGTEIATYLNGSYTQVLQKIATRHGLRAQITASTLTMEYVLQAGTDLSFLETVCERLGFSWFIDDDKTLVVKKLALASPAATMEFGTDLDSFSVRASGLRPTAVSVHGWDPDQQREITDTNPAATAATSAAFVRPYLGTSPGSSLTASATSVADRPPLTTSEAKTMAGAYYDDWTAAAVVARGSCDIDSAIKPGCTVRIKDAGPVSGDYLVTSVDHQWSEKGGFTTRFECGPRRPAGMVDTLGPPSVDAGFAVTGLVIGVVTDANDPDNAGRVKVKYAGINGEIESPWARVVTLGAGPARGAVFQPEVKDEVLVGFEHSDTRRPVVLGGLYSKRNTLPTGEKYVANGKVAYRRITSRKNHVVELADGDTPATQHVLLKLGTKEHKLRLGADRFDVEVTAGTPVSVKSGSASFEISNSGEITIKGTKVTIKADSELVLEGGAKATLKSNGSAAVEGTQVQVKATATGSVEASGPLTLKGAMVAIN